ncbi:MAG TPA: hypothetical protein VKN62_09450 [Pelovirga sp.]|nr:hypothetical protein [Pelovirga sp.]
MELVFDATTVITWLLFLALFPLAFFWLRRAKRILIDKNYSEVALKRGLPPQNPAKFALIAGLINLLAGGTAALVVIGLPLYIATGIELGPFANYENWSAIGGVTIWSKLMADFILSRYAHPFQFGKKKDV